MKMCIRAGCWRQVSAAFAAVLTCALAVGEQAMPSAEDSPKSQMLQQMQDLAKQFNEARQRPGAEARREQDRLLREYRSISRSLGGDDPAGLGGVSMSTSATPREDEGGIAAAPVPPVGCSATTLSFAQINPVPIPVVPNSVVASTITVAGAGPFIWDVNLTTFLQHTAGADLDITLTSPAGTVVTITTDNGGTNDNVFNGTTWDDDANPAGQVPAANNQGLVTDAVYANNLTLTPLVPEEALGAFHGENPNGVWTLRVFDDVGGDAGVLTSWALDIVTVAAAPTTASAAFTIQPAALIPSGPSLIISDIVVSGASSVITDVNVLTRIEHTAAADLDITLRSPGGTIVTLTTDNGGTNDNVFNGTLWDDDADPDGALPYTTNDGLVTDALYANNVVETPLVPEEALAAFIGENPNGTWTLTISDDAASNGGMLQEWELSLQTTPSLPASTLWQFQNTSPSVIEPPLVISNSVIVSGVSGVVWDIDLTTFITHSANGDLDITLTSPAGTTVTLTTDNGANADNVFGGTFWDDQADSDGLAPYSSNEGLVNDCAYGNAIVETPLVGEEGFGAFVGEDPNGTWTLTVSDDMPAVDGGSLDEWTLHVTSLSPGTTLGSPSVFASGQLNLPIASASPNVVTSTIAVSGTGTYLGDLVVSLDVSHSFNSDLDITVTSPAGRNVTLTTDNGAAFDNVFAGVTFDDDADPDGIVPYVFNDGLATDHNYVDFVVPMALAPEEALASMIGQDPNGEWVLTVSDDSASDGGTLHAWSITLRACECGGGGNPCPANIATGPGSENSVNIDDLLAVISAWGPCPAPPAACPANIATGPGSETSVNIDDLLAVISAWGPCP